MTGSSVVEISNRYENWMKANLPSLNRAISTPNTHRWQKRGRELPFDSYGGLSYLWSLRFPQELPELIAPSVPTVLGLGDVHIENFGTWRDSEGRLIWVPTISMKPPQCLTPMTLPVS